MTRTIRSRGDTIVEVMVSMAVLAIVVAATYSLSTRSFQSGQDSQYRDQAVSLAQQQLELIKESDNSNPQTITAYTNSPDTAYCIDPATKARRPADQCTFNNLYTVTYKYISATDTFQVAAAWDSSNGTRQQATIYYKPNDSFKDALQPPCQLDTDPLCSSTKTDVPAVGVHSSPPNPVIYGSAVTITWDYTNVQAGSCVPSSSPTNSAFNSVNPNSVNSFTSSSLPAGDDTFMITCRDNANNPVLGQVLVVIQKPSPTVVTGGYTGVTYYSATLYGSVNGNGYPAHYRFEYGTTTAYGQYTNVTDTGSGYATVSAYVGLASSTTYHYRICAYNAYVLWTCGDDASLTTYAPPPSVVSFSANPSSINYGGGSTLSWSSSNASGCHISGVAVGTSGNSYNVYPTSTTTYSLYCSNSAGTSSGTSYATVTVSQPLSFCWNSAGPCGGYCYHITEPSDPDTWNDNYLCANRNLGLCWTHDGVPGDCNGSTPYCTQWREDADPDTWGDNYLCSPVNYGFRWNSAGPIGGMNCIATYEAAEPSSHTWGDNYWCWPTGI
jgi:prepilin-type N-terminal cleavage/methylation domain-containing protein